METISFDQATIDQAAIEAGDQILAEQERRDRQRKMQEIRERMERAGFPPRHSDATLKSFEAPSADRAEVLRRAIGYADLFRDRKSLPASCLLICGRPGTGKTHLAVGIARRVAVTFGIRYATVSGLARAVRSSYSKLASKTELDILEDHLSPSLLVLDEVGVGLGTDHERAMMHDVLAGRYDRKKPSIMISNLSLDEVRTALGDRIVDRIREDSGVVLECNWESWRGRS